MRAGKPVVKPLLRRDRVGDPPAAGGDETDAPPVAGGASRRSRIRVVDPAAFGLH